MAFIRTPEVRAREVTADQAAEYVQPEPQHVWVDVDGGITHARTPGLLVEWRRPLGAQWQARVVYLEVLDGRWVQAHAWLPAQRVHPLT